MLPASPHLGKEFIIVNNVTFVTTFTDTQQRAVSILKQRQVIASSLI